MKKIYTALMLAAMSVGAVAADYVPVNSSVPYAQSREIAMPDAMKKPDKFRSEKIVRKIAKPGNATRTEAIGEDLLGEYYITYVDMYIPVDLTGRLIFNSTGEIVEEIGYDEYTMNFPFVYDVTEEGVIITTMPFPVHVSGNKIIFKTEEFETNVGMMELRVYHYVEDGQNVSMNIIDEASVEFTGSGFSPDRNYMLAVYDETEKYELFMAAYSTFQKTNAPSSVFNIGWTSLGKGTYQDGWMMSLYQEGHQSEYLYEVEIQQSEIDENVYRIVNPYGVNTPFANVNEGARLNGSIQFNVSDPDHVYFQAVPTNYMNEVQRLSQIYATNQLTTYVEGLGWDLESAIEQMDGYDLWATFKDGILTVPSRYNATGDYYENDALFCAPELGLGSVPYLGINWAGENGLPLNMEAKLYFPGVYEAGVEGIEADSNAPVKYYNLQGVEVANPVKGQLLIKRQGGKTEKIVF